MIIWLARVVLGVHAISECILMRYFLVQAPSALPKLVVVDSISALLAPIIGATQHHQGD